MGGSSWGESLSQNLGFNCLRNTVVVNAKSLLWLAL